MFHRILVALDNSGLAELVIKAVLQLKLLPETKIVLAHVIAVSEDALEQPADRPYTDPQLGQFRHIEKELQGFQELLPCPSDLEIVSGDPPEEIIRLANIHKADLIVMGSRGLTGMNRILQGSVSSQVVSEALCSVMVVKGGHDQE
jgi:nucleotide-binding universal stress UspA family protein